MSPLLATIALAGPCEEAMELLAEGTSPELVARWVATRTWTEDEQACLVAHRAPRRVLVAAAGRRPEPDPWRRPLELSIGGSLGTNRLLGSLGGPQAGVAWFPAPILGLEARVVAAAPTTSDWIAALPEEAPLPKATAEVPVVGTVAGRLALATGTLGRRFGDTQRSRWQAQAVLGLGVVGTHEDANVLLHTPASADQVHGAFLYGGALDLRATRTTGLRLQLDDLRWAETRVVDLGELGRPYEAVQSWPMHRTTVSAVLTLRLDPGAPTRR